MKVLVIGSGGREHALVWKLAQSPLGPRLYCAPGNAGTAELAENLDIRAEDIDGLARWACEKRPDLTVVGPEAPLCAGLVDRWQAEGLVAFGPTQAAAQLEGSKVFSKEVMRAGGVPTAGAATFTDAGAAVDFVRRQGCPLVVKAEGLAAGKGVVICRTVLDAEEAILDMMVRGVFGAAGRRVLVEEYLEGEEASILALVDGERVVLLESAQDHKRALDNDQGPNTGGMGAYSPAPVVSERWKPVIEREVFGRTLTELKRRRIVYRGVLYAGLMMTAEGPKVLEFNCRFGDPETQAILPRLASDLLPALQACAEGTLRPEMLRWRPEACVTVVMAAVGYPGAYEKGRVISGLDQAAGRPGTVVFHAGTHMEGGRTVTAGGRVLNVTATGVSLEEAARRAYEAVADIRFEGAMWRRDIAARALRRSG